MSQRTLYEVMEKWRKNANASRKSLNNLKAKDEAEADEWATELETNMRDLDLCADELQPIADKLRVAVEEMRSAAAGYAGSMKTDQGVSDAVAQELHAWAKALERILGGPNEK